MCGPAAVLPLMIASTAMTAAGTGFAALQASAQGKYQAKIAERNAAMERESAQQSILNTREEPLAHYRKVGTLKGAQRARAAANGVGVNFGTAADVLADTEMLGREDVNRIYKRGNQRTRGFEMQASNFMGRGLGQAAGCNRGACRRGFQCWLDRSRRCQPVCRTEAELRQPGERLGIGSGQRLGHSGAVLMPRVPPLWPGGGLPFEPKVSAVDLTPEQRTRQAAQIPPQVFEAAARGELGLGWARIVQGGR